MSVLFLVAAIVAASPTDAWIESSIAEFKLADLSLETAEKEIILRVPVLDSLSAQTHDHLLASFFATLGQELVSDKETKVRVEDANGNLWRHDALDLSFFDPSKQRDGETRQAYRTRYEGGALAGIHLGLSAGHGIMWDDGVWRYQRSELFELREDLHTNQIMNSLIIPMLERMGAKLTVVRGVGFEREQVILDNADSFYVEHGTWLEGSSPGGWNNGYRVIQTDTTESAVTRWTWIPEVSGELPVYIWYVAGENRSPSALLRIGSGEHFETVRVNQTERGSRWVYLGTFPFQANQEAWVEISNLGTDTTQFVVADALWIGGGTGTVDFGGGTSGQTFWEQSAQVQSREFSLPSEITNPYGDVTVRPAWALWEGVDLYVSLHTNAGGGRGTSTFVYSNQVAYPSFDPNRAESIPPGSLELQNAIHDRMVESAQRFWDPSWRDRGKWGANFGELRPLTLAWREDADMSIPAMLIELAFHDSEDDTYYLREERFRRDMARAIVRGILDFVYRDSADPPSLPPEPPVDLLVQGNLDERRLSWRSQSDPIDYESVAQSYRIERSQDGRAFFPFALTTETSIALSESEACSRNVWRVVAINESGESLASESVIDIPTYVPSPRVLWVDGHRRWVQTVNEAPARPTPAHEMSKAFAVLSERGIRLDSARAEIVAGGAVELGAYDLVVWSAGETSTVDQSLTGAERAAIESYLESGGTLLLSGSELAWHLGRSFDDEELMFFEDILGASYVADAASSYEVAWRGFDGQSLVEMTLDDGSGNYQRVGYPDVVQSLVGGLSIAEYGDYGEIAGLMQPVLNGQLIYLAFPFEALKNPIHQTVILEDILDSFPPFNEGFTNGCVDAEGFGELGPDFSAIDLEGDEGTPIDEEPVGDDNLDYAASESGCTGCHNAQNISFWLILALVVIPLKRRLYGLSHARISRS